MRLCGHLNPEISFIPFNRFPANLLFTLVLLERIVKLDLLSAVRVLRLSPPLFLLLQPRLGVLLFSASPLGLFVVFPLPLALLLGLFRFKILWPSQAPSPFVMPVLRLVKQAVLGGWVVVQQYVVLLEILLITRTGVILVDALQLLLKVDLLRVVIRLVTGQILLVLLLVHAAPVHQVAVRLLQPFYAPFFVKTRLFSC